MSKPIVDNRNYLIDLLRFLAAAWVAIFHFNEPVVFIDNWYRSFLKYGYLGVPIFFVISGYCVYLAAEHSKNAKDFIIRRFFRIFPPYWFSIFLVCAVVVFFLIVYGANSVTVLPKNATGVLATLTLMAVPYSKVPIINWVYWSLTFEVFFYLVIFIFLLFTVKFRAYWLIFISLITLLLPIHEDWIFFFIKHWPEFTVGIITYRLLHYPTKELWQNIVLTVLTLLGLTLIEYLSYYVTTCAITCALITINHFYPLKKNFFSTLGDYSYSVYLIHVPISIYLFGKIKQTHFIQTNIYANIIWDFILLSFTIFLAKLMYTYIEVPAIKLGKKYANMYSRTIDAN